jgi:hypothetical protein
MARRKRSSRSSSKRHLSATQIIFYVLSFIIVLSMAIGFVISALPTPSRQQTIPTPTPVVLATFTPTPTDEPTATPTPATEEPSIDGTVTPPSNQ